MTSDITAALEQVREWYRLADEGYKNPHHPIMAGSPDCPTCVAEGNLNRLFGPHLGLKLVEALEGHDCMYGCGSCDALTEFAEEVERLQ